MDLQKSRPKTSVLDFDRETVLDLIRKNLAEKNICAAYVFGSFARDESHLWSDVDLIIIKDSPLPFVERPREFFDLLGLGIHWTFSSILLLNLQKCREKNWDFGRKSVLRFSR